MISFIIIGKNEGWKLSKCFESVFNFIKSNSIKDYEVIYVDSKSIDDSIERAEAFPEIKIFLITGVCNAAIARNIGAKESKGDILFFIDGDMEILANFYKAAFNENMNLRYEFISGCWINFNYDSSWNLISKLNYKKNIKDEYEHTTGGIFIITKNLWEEVGGMRTKYMRNQDLDLGLRLSKIGYPILRKKEIIANHHTIPYNDNKRKWKLLFNSSEFYPMVLFREHILYKKAWKIFIFENYTLLFFLLSILISFTCSSYYFFIIYFFILLYKSFRTPKSFIIDKVIHALKLFLRDIFRLFALLLFFPSNKKIEYKKIQ